jgi:hypothetical protein
LFNFNSAFNMVDAILHGFVERARRYNVPWIITELKKGIGRRDR